MDLTHFKALRVEHGRVRLRTRMILMHIAVIFYD